MTDKHRLTFGVFSEQTKKLMEDLLATRLFETRNNEALLEYMVVCINESEYVYLRDSDKTDLSNVVSLNSQGGDK